MSTTRQPLLTEEQIQEMLEYANNKAQVPTQSAHFALKWIRRHQEWIWGMCIDSNNIPQLMGMDTFLAFLRGKTKRVLNLDRLRADVKAWVDDPDRKYPGWWLFLGQDIENAFDNFSEDLDDEGICCYAVAIGINPDDYFEEVEVTE